ncbi:MAG: FecR domain-containing protein [Steroidobacteraceae bacterium]
MSLGVDKVDESLTVEEEASSDFLRRLQGEWTESDQIGLETRLTRDQAYANAYQRAEESWDILGAFAEAPEVVSRREKSLAYARRSSVRRWVGNRSVGSRWRLVAVAAGIVILLAMAWQVSPYGYRAELYQTGIGEQRMIDLEDHSRVVLNAKTRMRVRYTRDARVVQMQEGEAQFYVAKDPTRPFKVQVGDRLIVALGTVFTVEYIEKAMRVAMVEGRVAVYSPSSEQVADGGVTPSGGGADKLTSKDSAGSHAVKSAQAAGSSSAIELGAGEELSVARDGGLLVAPADIESATAWRDGKVILKNTRLGEAVRRFNRYSRVQIRVDDEALTAREISGVFEAGDAQGFVSAVQHYYPVMIEYVDKDVILLRSN